MKDKHQDQKKLDFSDEIKRFNRVIGQIEGIQKMLKSGRSLDDIVVQCKAIHSAIQSVEQRVFKVYVEGMLSELVKLDKKKERTEYVEELEKLFKKVS